MCNSPSDPDENVDQILIILQRLDWSGLRAICDYVWLIIKTYVWEIGEGPETLLAATTG